MILLNFFLFPPFISRIQNLSGKLKHVKDDWGEGYPDSDHCRLMVDRLACPIFLQQQQQQAEVQLLHVEMTGKSPAETCIFSSIKRVRGVMGDSADRVLLLLFLLKGEGCTYTPADSVSLNSTPMRPYQSSPSARDSPAPLPLAAASILLPTSSRQDALVPIPPLGQMQASRILCRFRVTVSTLGFISLPPPIPQASATCDLWLWDPSEHESGKSRSTQLSELFGALKPLPDASLPTYRDSSSIGPNPSLPPLPHLPVAPKLPGRSLQDVCTFYSNSMTSRDACLQPLENEPAYFFRAFTDVAQTLPSVSDEMAPIPSRPEFSHMQLSSPSATGLPASSIWQDPLILMVAPPPHCEPCTLSPLFSMLPSEIMASGACIFSTVDTRFHELFYQCWRGLRPGTALKLLMKALCIGTVSAL